MRYLFQMSTAFVPIYKIASAIIIFGSVVLPQHGVSYNVSICTLIIRIDASPLMHGQNNLCPEYIDYHTIYGDIDVNASMEKIERKLRNVRKRFYAKKYDHNTG